MCQQPLVKISYITFSCKPTPLSKRLLTYSQCLISFTHLRNTTPLLIVKPDQGPLLAYFPVPTGSASSIQLYFLISWPSLDFTNSLSRTFSFFCLFGGPDTQIPVASCSNSNLLPPEAQILGPLLYMPFCQNPLPNTWALSPVWDLNTTPSGGHISHFDREKWVESIGRVLGANPALLLPGWGTQPPCRSLSFLHTFKSMPWTCRAYSKGQAGTSPRTMWINMLSWMNESESFAFLLQLEMGYYINFIRWCKWLICWRLFLGCVYYPSRSSSGPASSKNSPLSTSPMEIPPFSEFRSPEWDNVYNTLYRLIYSWIHTPPKWQ